MAALGVTRWAGEHHRVAAFCLELPLTFGGALLAYRASLARFPPGTSRSRAARTALSLLGLLALAQMVKQKHTYPLLAFTMYGNAPPAEVHVYEYRAELRSGRRLRLRPSTLLPSLGSARIVRGLARRLDASRDPRTAADRARAASDQFQRTMRALIELHDRARPLEPIRHVDVYRVRLKRPHRTSGGERTWVARVEAPAP